MNELIKVNCTDGEKITVSGRELHEALGVNTQYSKWFERMTEYGFNENEDYILVSQKRLTNNPKNPYTEIIDHAMTIDMAKEICMIQRSDKGKQFRQYFIDVEKKWNTPEAVMARALQMANRKLDEIRQSNIQLETRVQEQAEQIEEMKPKVSYYDVILNCKDLTPIGVIAQDYGMSAYRLNKILESDGIQYKRGKHWYIKEKYKKMGLVGTKPFTVPGTDGEIHANEHLYWTQAGRKFIYDHLKDKYGILPTVELQAISNLQGITQNKYEQGS